MELHISEFDDLEPTNLPNTNLSNTNLSNNNSNTNSYGVNKKLKKKTCTYDDILSKLNMQIVGGVLCVGQNNTYDPIVNGFNNATQPKGNGKGKGANLNRPNLTGSTNNSCSSSKSCGTTKSNGQQKPTCWRQLVELQEQQQQQQTIVPPMSREEYIHQQRQAYIQQEMQRMKNREAKSTKLFFSNPNIRVSRNGVNHNLNRLF